MATAAAAAPSCCMCHLLCRLLLLTRSEEANICHRSDDAICGAQIASDGLKGRVFECNLADLQNVSAQQSGQQCPS